jgi:hypothetical protein
MDIRIADRTDGLNSIVRTSFERSLGFALSRFAEEIDYVSVVTSDLNGPRGGVDKRCVLRANTHRYGCVEVTQDCTQLGSGLSRAARRLGHSLSRTIKQKRAYGRDSIRHMNEPDSSAAS